MLYEVTGSGVYQDFNHDILNGNRLRARSCDHQGDGPFNQACVFPFRYQVHIMAMLEMVEMVMEMEMVEMEMEEGSSRMAQGETYEECTYAGSEVSWCSTLTDHTDNHQSGYWGNCAPLDQVVIGHLTPDT